jgi:hypothetical protein
MTASYEPAKAALGRCLALDPTNAAAKKMLATLKASHACSSFFVRLPSGCGRGSVTSAHVAAGPDSLGEQPRHALM